MVKNSIADTYYLRCLLIAISFLISMSSYSQDSLPNKKTIEYITIDTTILKMDIYGLNGDTTKKPCIIFMFGGGFIGGARDAKKYMNYINLLIRNHFIVASIDYRLGMKGKHVSALNTTPLKNAINLAVNDLFSATNYILKNATLYNIDSTKIILSGSSSGAISVMTGEWEKSNSTKNAKALPPNFNYAGVISFAGAIFSTSGKPSYKIAPPPIMMFHGTDDKLVFYKQKRFLNKGIFGSASLAGVYKKNKYPYYFQSVVGMGHEVAETPMNENQNDIIWFINQYIFNKKKYMMEVKFDDPEAIRTFTKSAKDIY